MLKLLPLIVTRVPGFPEVGEKDVIDGCAKAFDASMEVKHNKKNLFNLMWIASAFEYLNINHKSELSKNSC